MSRILFAPISVAFSFLAGLVGKRLFEHLWAAIDENEPPEPGHRQSSLRKIVVAAALQGAVFRVVRALTDRGTRRAFAGVTGSWPGEQRPDRTP